jgi:hypothetical protein
MSFLGQITQWNLIFHGTSDPPQRNDPPRYLNGGSANNKKTVNDLIHNSLDNSQWSFMTSDVSIFPTRRCLQSAMLSIIQMPLETNTHACGERERSSWCLIVNFIHVFIMQVAEMGSHTDVQRTVDDDLTSSACLHYSENNKSFCLGLCLFIIILINKSLMKMSQMR